MKRILYASGGFLTDDATAESLMEYARVLAVINSADVVRCQAVDDGGAVRDLQLLVGPASQILSMDTDEPHVELDKAVSNELRDRARRRLPDPMEISDAGAAGPRETDAESTTHED